MNSDGSSARRVPPPGQVDSSNRLREYSALNHPIVPTHLTAAATMRHTACNQFHVEVCSFRRRSRNASIVHLCHGAACSAAYAHQRALRAGAVTSRLARGDSHGSDPWHSDRRYGSHGRSGAELLPVRQWRLAGPHRDPRRLGLVRRFRRSLPEDQRPAAGATRCADAVEHAGRRVRISESGPVSSSRVSIWTPATPRESPRCSHSWT